MKKKQNKNKRAVIPKVLSLTVIGLVLGLSSCGVLALTGSVGGSQQPKTSADQANVSSQTQQGTGTTELVASPATANTAAAATNTPKPTSTATTTPKTTRTTPSNNQTVSAPANTSPSSSDIAPESACPGQTDVGQTSTVLVCMTSYARVTDGLSKVTANSQLMASAADKTVDIKNCGFSHTACGRPFTYWITTDGYNGGCVGENIAEGQTTPGEVFNDWMESPEHRANILNAAFADIGVAQLGSSGGIIWVMHLGDHC